MTTLRDMGGKGSENLKTAVRDMGVHQAQDTWYSRGSISNDRQRHDGWSWRIHHSLSKIHQAMLVQERQNGAAGWKKHTACREKRTDSIKD